MKRFEIVTGPILVQDIIDKVIRAEAGAVNTFIGTVRELTKGKRTVFLKYEAYIPMAERQLAKIGDEISARWPGSRTAISHRIGSLDISDIAVVIAVSTPHRAEAFDACRYAIERIKEIVPIWKKEHWDNGEMWVGDQLETAAYSKGHPESEEDKND
ncbi:molybdenum cofactor biosynthesis protein MoaE [Fictibacillus sp. KIGAM418]|uniref:Molybdopterin synthase catalytic subunit n=1 Tax=Fictibacillus marinisediminis TaxID=2878389 RepID=A0A9X2BC88_9BACL|nr:molybdenum cofactor biosynthesis protein MoaE [Fictibacillus marinisediminis]MCK6256719.1 molybdenum cofactor biosynthesis protein MoaE [Fictibacillus marinisediminis]